MYTYADMSCRHIIHTQTRRTPHITLATYMQTRATVRIPQRMYDSGEEETEGEGAQKRGAGCEREGERERRKEKGIQSKIVLIQLWFAFFVSNPRSFAPPPSTRRG